jgi:hypothetical protein
MLKRIEDKPVDSKAAEVAAIAAGVFTALGSTAATAGEYAPQGGAREPDKSDSNWKNTSRREALR